MNQDDLVRFLRTKLLEKSEELKGVEAHLKAVESTAQVAAEREDFILSELAAIVSDLDCKFIVPLFPRVLGALPLLMTLLFCRYPRERSRGTPLH